MFLPRIFLLISSVSSVPQLFSLNIGFGNDETPVTFFQDSIPSSVPGDQPSVPARPTPAPAPQRPAFQQEDRRSFQQTPVSSISHEEALRQNALQRQQLAETVSQHRTGGVRTG